jgi:hypothetical protein
MNTKILMTSSAIILGIAGIILTFMNEEILGYLGFPNHKPLQFLVQIIAALYFGFGMLNWMTKTSIIGGIYNRPIATANFTHFFIGGLALIKGLISNPALHYIIWIIAVIYLTFGAAFGFILFRHPISEK